MERLEIIKFLAELITSISAAIIVLERVFIIVAPVMRRVKKPIKLFFVGIKDTNGKKVRLFKAIKVNREYQKQLKELVKVVAPDIEMKEILVLNKEELLKAIAESKIFSRVSLRKE